MFQSKERNAKEEIKAALRESDFTKLLSIGFAKFMDLICGDGPMPFQKFLKYTGDYLDKCILDISRNRHLNYVGGKLILELERTEGDMPETILLFADFYFQTADKQWIVEKKQGKVSADRFRDWGTDPDAIKLQETGRSELSIEPPEVGAK